MRPVMGELIYVKDVALHHPFCLCLYQLYQRYCWVFLGSADTKSGRYCHVGHDPAATDSDWSF